MDGDHEKQKQQQHQLVKPAAPAAANFNFNFGRRTAHNLSSSSELDLQQQQQQQQLIMCNNSKKKTKNMMWGSIFACSSLGSVQEVIFGTKLSPLFLAIPLAIIAYLYRFGSAWIFVLSLVSLTPLAERVSFLTEQVSFYTGPTVGGLLNATCGNVTEVIIAILALTKGKVNVVKCSLLGSILSNLLMVLGTSLLCGGIAKLIIIMPSSRSSSSSSSSTVVAHLQYLQTFDKTQSDVNCGLLLMALLCHTMPLLLKLHLHLQYHQHRHDHIMSSSLDIDQNIHEGSTSTTTSSTTAPAISVLHLSRVLAVAMLLAYAAFLFFQLHTSTPSLDINSSSLINHHDHMQAADDHNSIIDEEMGEQDGGAGDHDHDHDHDVNQVLEEEEEEEEEAVLGAWCAVAWLVGMTTIISLLSEFVVGTIEEASESLGISVNFISIILLPIVGNAAEHAGAIIFAVKNKLDISLGVALGSATQISLFVVPLTVIVAWGMGIGMDLDLNIPETSAFFFSVIVTNIVLQDGTSHYLKGLVLLLCYFMMGALFFFIQTPLMINDQLDNQKKNTLNATNLQQSSVVSMHSQYGTSASS